MYIIFRCLQSYPRRGVQYKIQKWMEHGQVTRFSQALRYTVYIYIYIYRIISHLLPWSAQWHCTHFKRPLFKKKKLFCPPPPLWINHMPDKGVLRVPETSHWLSCDHFNKYLHYMITWCAVTSTFFIYIYTEYTSHTSRMIIFLWCNICISPLFVANKGGNISCDLGKWMCFENRCKRDLITKPNSDPPSYVDKWGDGSRVFVGSSRFG